MIDSSKEILECFLKGKFKRMNCPQCENTFLTNVYEMKCFDHGKKLSVKCSRCKQMFFADTTGEAWSNYVILEKYALGLEYICEAIKYHEVESVPFIRRVGILDENDNNLDPSVIHLFSHEEPDYRLIYVMERLEHLEEADAAFFTEHVYGMDWKDDKTRAEIYANVKERYGTTLSEDIRKLCLYFRIHEAHLSWDLHGDNLMRRTRDGKLVIMDPYAPKMGEYMENT
jgi:ribosomal protein S27E